MRRALIIAAITLCGWTGIARAQSEGFLTMADGARLFYRRLGSGPQTVIIPASLFLHPAFARVAEGRTVIMYDMRNRGRSSMVTDTTRLTIDEDVRDLEAIRAHFGAERFTPIGWSYLGFMVMLYAQRYPERVDRIIQIGPVAREWQTRFPRELTANDSVPVIDSAASQELGRLRASGLAERDPRAFCERQYVVQRVQLVGDPRLADRVPNVCAFEPEWPLNFERHLRYHFGSIQRLRPPSWEEFAKITVPVLTIHGTKDRNAPYGSGREWAAHLPNAKFVSVPGAAHMPWIDQPELVFGEIERFLGASRR
jgi:pimeloyl-ACP methyl ester carboxylesterase